MDAQQERAVKKVGLGLLMAQVYISKALDVLREAAPMVIDSIKTPKRKKAKKRRKRKKAA